MGTIFGLLGDRLCLPVRQRDQYFRKDLRLGGDWRLIVVDRYEGSRDDLRHVFKRVEGSPTSVDSCLDLGRILVGRARDVVVGHPQLIPTGRADGTEIKKMKALAP